MSEEEENSKCHTDTILITLKGISIGKSAERIVKDFNNEGDNTAFEIPKKYKNIGFFLNERID